MKALKNITQIAFFALLVLSVTSGCKKSAELSIAPIPVVTPFTFQPTHGYPGSQVVIEGTGLSDISTVSFGMKAAGVVSKTDTKITATIPVGALTAKIKLVKNSVVVTAATDFVIDATPIPTIIQFTPAIAGSGETVSITGNLLDQVDSVYVGTLKADIVAGKTATLLKIVTRTGLQSGKIRMFYNYQTSYGMTKVAESVSSTNLVLKLAVITSVSPDVTALNVGDQLTITGTLMSKVTSVKFGTIAAVFTTTSDTELMVTVPAGATTGKITLTVPDGATDYKDNYIVTLPGITSFFPTKGAEIPSPGTRDITITGTKLDLVTSVKVGSTVATIVAQTATNLTFKILGATSGTISLIVPNGTVLSATPFIITGDFWLYNANDTPISPARCTIAPNSTGSAINQIVAGGPTGAYLKLGGTTTSGQYPRTYISGVGTGEDLFMLYTPDANGVTFSFDIAYESLPSSFIQANGSVTIQIFSFTSGDRVPYGFHKNIIIPFTGANNWQHVTVAMKDLIEAGSSGLIGNTPGSATAKRCKPNKMRIMGLVFTNNPTNSTDPIVWDLDNVKFTIN